MVQTTFYIIGGALAVLAVLLSFVGLRSERFPTRGAMGVGLVLLVGLVVASSATAILSARDEQMERREEANREAAEEAEGELEEAEEAEQGEGEGEAAQPGEEPEIDRLGAQVFADAGCGGCHTLAAAETTGTIGPDLDEALPGRDEEFIRTSIVDPNAEIAAGFGPDVMPPDFGEELSPEELDALAAFLARNAGQGGPAGSGGG